MNVNSIGGIVFGCLFCVEIADYDAPIVPAIGRLPSAAPTAPAVQAEAHQAEDTEGERESSRLQMSPAKKWRRRGFDAALDSIKSV